MYLFDIYIPLNILWFAAAALFLIIELLTTALVSIWFVPSSLIAGIVAMFTDNIAIQICVFIVLSILCFPVSKYIYDKKFSHGSRSQFGSIIGKTGVVIVPVTAFSGRVLVGDVAWEARTRQGTIPESEMVQIVELNGLTAGVISIKKGDC